MTIDLDALEKLARAATPGPYVLGERDGKSVLWAWNDQTLELTIEGRNAPYFASANPAAVLELVQRLRVAEAPKVMVSSPAAAGEPLVTVSKRRWDEAQAIVRDLAAKEPHAERPGSPLSGIPHCALCEAVKFKPSGVHDHAESCPWRRAVETVKP
jgi:hypothetical protein